MYEEEMAKRPHHLCERCKTTLFLDVRFDAWWCPRCDSWAEGTCGQSAEDCSQCAARPMKPSDARLLRIVA